MSEEKKQTGVEKFKEKYGIDYDDLIVLPIKNTGIYKQNYKILYDKKTDQCFSLWSSPYQQFIYIENEGFITIDPDLRKANDDYIQEHFKLEYTRLNNKCFHIFLNNYKIITQHFFELAIFQG